MTLAYSVFAESNENVMPPTGPYRSQDEMRQTSVKPNLQFNPQLQNNQDYSSARNSQFNRNAPATHPAPMPEWEMQRRAQMEQWMKQRQAQMDQQIKQPNMQPPQGWNNQQPQNHKQLQAMPHPNIGPGPQNNRAQQYFPSARGPVYGPGGPPPGFNGQPGYQPPAQWNPYPPVRR